jgi:GTPase SAR1 family protein
LKVHAPTVPIILVGLKTDDRAEGKTVNKVVATQQGQKLAASIKAVAYMEACSKSGEGVKELFDKAIDVSINPPPPRMYTLAPSFLFFFFFLFPHPSG